MASTTRQLPLTVRRERADGTTSDLEGTLEIPTGYAWPELTVNLGDGIDGFRVRAAELVDADGLAITVDANGHVTSLGKSRPELTINDTMSVSRVRELPVEIIDRGESVTESFEVPQTLPETGEVALRFTHTNGQNVALWIPVDELRTAQKLRVLVDEQDGIVGFSVQVVSTDPSVPIKLLENELRREFKKGQLAAFAGLYSASPTGTLPVRADHPSQVVLTDESVAKLAEAFKELPTPQVTVNVENDDAPQSVTFQRDPQGRITSAEIE